MVAFVILSDKPTVSRQEVAEAFWPEQSKAQANRNLRQLLLALRRWQDQEHSCLLHADAHSLSRDGECLPTDLDAFLAIQAPHSVAGLERLLDLYRDELLAGLTVGSSTADDWLWGIRDQLADRFYDLVVAGSLTVEGEIAHRALRQAAAARPWNEQVLRAQMLVLGREGKPQEAKRLYQGFRKRLHTDLGVEPETETTLLMAEIEPKSPVATVLNSTRKPDVGIPPEQCGIPRVLLLSPEVSTPHIPPVLAEAFVDDVTYTLCRSRTFAVFAPFTARSIANGRPFAGTDVDYLITSRVLPPRRGGAVGRLTFVMVRVDTGQVLAADEFEFAAEEYSRAHTLMAETIAQGLSASIADFELNLFRRSGAASAYVHYLLGCGSLHPHDLRTIRRSARSFRQATRLAPNYSPAIAMLARSKVFEWLQLGRPDKAYLKGAGALVGEALAREPLDPVSNREMGHVALYQGDLDAALHHFDQAARTSPHHADILADRADVLTHACRWTEAETTIDHALDLNPAAPDDYLWVKGAVCFFTYRYSEGLSHLKRMKNSDMAVRLMAACATMVGDKDEARVLVRRSLTRDPDFTVSKWTALFPQRDPADTEHYLEALRRAGFPR